MKANFAENLKLARKARGYTQAELAETLGISRSSYTNYETGNRTPDIEMLEKITWVLNISMDELFGRYDFGTPNLIRDERAVYQVHVENPEYTVEDYFALENCAEYELIEGSLVKRNAPAMDHQIASLQISMALYKFIADNKGGCQVIPAPFCVILSEEDATVVQPDISVICDLNKLKDGCCFGAPDILVEIISPSNRKYDYLKKTFLYDRYEVREYWIVDLEQGRIIVYDFENGTGPQMMPLHEDVCSCVLEGFTLNLGKLLDTHEAQFVQSDI